MSIVTLRDIRKVYGEKVAVEGLSLTIEPGTMFGLLGPNGSGKTSSIRMMIGITVPGFGDGGAVWAGVWAGSFEADRVSAGGAWPLQEDECHGSACVPGAVARVEGGGGAGEGARVVRADADHGGDSEEDGGSFEGDAAEDSVHCGVCCMIRTWSLWMSLLAGWTR